MKIQNIKFSHTEANLLPEDHEENLKYDKFLEIFGEEGNLLLLAIQDPSVFTAKNFKKWNDLSKKLDSFPEVDFTTSIGSIQKLKKDSENQKFYVEPLFDSIPETDAEIESIRKDLFENLPFTGKHLVVSEL